MDDNCNISIGDNFPYRGVSGSVCEGCVYSGGITGNGEGCGRLQYLRALYDSLTGAKRQDVNLKGILYSNRKTMSGYQGEEGFKRFVANMLLDDYVDKNRLPKDVFMFVWNQMKDLDRETYLQAVGSYCSILEEAIPRRADIIIGRLETILGEAE